jgi:hypothetical protein
MRWSKAVTAAVLGTGLVGSVAQATLTVTVRPVLKDVGAPANSRTFDLIVTQNGERWNVSTMQGTVPNTAPLTGSLFNTTPDALTEVSPPIAGDPSVFDSSVTTPMWTTTQQAGALDVLGSSDYPSAAGAGTVGVLSGNTINIAWGDKQGNLNTTTTTNTQYRVARLTILGNTGSNISGYSAGNVQLNNAQAFTAYVPILGDTNADRNVDTSDYDLWFANLGGFSGTQVLSGDMNHDKNVDTSDYDIWFANLGNALPASGASLGALVPEPVSLGLLSVGGLLLARRRRSA